MRRDIDSEVTNIFVHLLASELGRHFKLAHLHDFYVHGPREIL
jgi:hypothetical protein